jgi:hypothetical protein
MEDCKHNHLIRDENTPEWYSCEACSQVFTIKPVGTEDEGHPVMGVRHTSGK